MTVENYLAEAAALAGLAGIMAGFSLAAVIQLLTASNSGRLVTSGIVVFSAASVMFLYSLIVAVLSLSAAAELGQIPLELENLNVGALLIMFAAIYVFVGGIGMAGWMRSRTAGTLTTIFALISACLITYAIGAVISLFMSVLEESSAPQIAGRFLFYLILNICISFIARFRSPASLILPCMKACIPSSSPVKILT